MKIILTDPISQISGIGGKRTESLNSSGIHTVLDLLRHKPVRYEDRRNLLPLHSLVESTVPQGVFRAVLSSIEVKWLPARKCLIWATFNDLHESRRARWFNRPYLIKNLKVGMEYFLFGAGKTIKNEIILDNPEIDTSDTTTDISNQEHLTPIYPKNSRFAKAGLSPKMLRGIIAKTIALIDWQNSFPDIHPGNTFDRIRQALIGLHRPKSIDDAKRAVYTLYFFDQVLFQLGVLKRRERFSELCKYNATHHLSCLERNSDETEHFKYFSAAPCSLPFELTDSQRQSLSEIAMDLKGARDSGSPMNRLLNGDVGSGKTIIAFLTMRNFAENIMPGARCAFMCPTEILAMQHMGNFASFFPEVVDQATVITGSIKGKERSQLQNKIIKGEKRYIFGTHALFQEDLVIPDLKLCIIDEQHRFGVDQRRALVSKGGAQVPNLLLMTATPIPRTLALTIFGDMDVSLLSISIPGRKPVITSILLTIEDAVPYLKEMMLQNEQGYLVCPVIDETTKSKRISVAEIHAVLHELIPELRSGILTGRQSSYEKAETMRSFSEGRLQMLIATSIIEVGIDNSNATLMIIQNAECFGLSQLHQLRGRVGRGNRQSRCLLISPESTGGERLGVMTASNDGFRLAAEDLRIRGPGDLVGTRQSGLMHPAFASLPDAGIIIKSRKRAMDILSSDSESERNWFLEHMRLSFGEDFANFMDGG